MTFTQPFAGYEILERVGSGAMGTVFKARDRKLARIVALKVLKPSLARNERYVERLRREARIVAGLNDPHIVAGYDLGEEGGYHFFVMEFVEGRSLRALLNEWGMFAEQQVLDVGIQVASALDHAYRRGVIHRDIKPGNILITDQNVVKLTDMGLAKGPSDVTITRDGATIGTPQYISPEQARDPQSADIRSDLYSLGATLFHMITGSPPFWGDTMAEVITKVLSERAPSASELNPAVTDGLSLVIRKLLAKDPDLRYLTPAELLADLRRVEAQLAPDVDVRRLERHEPGSRRRPGPAVVAALAGGALAIAALFWFLGDRSSERGGDRAFGRELATRFEKAATFGDKLKLLRSVQQSALTETERGVLEGLQLGLETEFRRAIDQLFGRYVRGDLSDSAEQWYLAPENWREPERFFAEVVDPAVERDLGVRSVELPTPLREVVARQQAELRSRARTWQQARDTGYSARFSDYLARELPAAWTAELENRDFAAAERALRDALDAFFVRDGMPTRAQLPDDLQASVDEREREARDQGLAVIAGEEVRLAEALKTRVAAGLAELQVRRRELRAVRVREQFDQLLREVETHPPSAAFRPAADPWREIQDDLKGFENSLASDLRFEEAEALDQAVNRAYRTLVASGDCDSAAAWVEHLQLHNDDNRALCDRHLGLLRAADEAVGAVCAAVLGKASKRLLRLRRAGDPTGRPMDVELTFDGQDYHFSTVPAGKALHPGEVYWADLVAAAGPDWLERVAPPDRARRRAGVALWLFATGDDAGTMELLDDEMRGFFANCVTEPLDRVRRQHEAVDVTALASLQAVHREFDREDPDLSAVQAALRGFRDNHGDDALDGDARSFLREVDDWVRVRAGQRALAQAFRAKAPAGTDVEVSGDRTVTLTFGVEGMSEPSLPAGWERAGDELAFKTVDVDLKAARSEGLEIQSHFEQAGEVSLEARLRFPALADRHRLYLFELHGVMAIVGLLRDGTVVATLGTPDLVERPSELRKRLQREIEDVAQKPRFRVVPDADYDLRIRWLAAGHRVKATVSINEVELASSRLARSSLTGDKARVMPLQPMRLSQVVMRGRI